MAKLPSLVLSLDESIDEKQQSDSCATTTEIPINDELVVQQHAQPVCLEDPNLHRRDLSTLRVLIVHIGYVNFVYHLSYHRLMDYSQSRFNSIPCNH